MQQQNNGQQQQKQIEFKQVQGRIVWELKNGLFQGVPVIDKNTGVQKINKSGQPRSEYGFGLAVPKNSQDAMVLIDAIMKEGYKFYQNGWPPNASKKYVDGDVDVDHMGIPFSQRDGYAGHYVFTLKSEIAIQYYAMQNGQQQKITSGIKCGDYVGVIVSVLGHPANAQTQAKAGVYINPYGCMFIREGAPIVKREGSGFDAGAMFGQFAGQAQPLNNAMPAFNQGQQQNNGWYQAPQQPHNGVLPQHMQNQFNGQQQNPNVFNNAGAAPAGASQMNQGGATSAQTPQGYQAPQGFNPFGNNGQ